ncbi:hypothetical protein Taro_010342 [Colocasia esculenta]|uniref:non-specific serine/threonine protein kinase n=1 Tax=Colocasia esculenta TaxID=4460 RepID=A0A843TYM8_COLES|nr:hypothetical protein [Colocasia esculenta]
MGCFPCFDSKEAEQLNPRNGSDDRREDLPMVPPQVPRLASGADRQRTRSNATSRKETQIQKDASGMNISAHIFAFRELAAATRNFSPECFLGEGGFGRVYKGKLESTGQVVAVKQLDRNGLQGNREFLVEVLMLSLLHHPNLVNLIGYCADGDQRLLVYEFMALGSLEDHLHGLRLFWSLHSSILPTDNFYLIVGRKWLQRERVEVFADESYCTIRDLDYPGCRFKFPAYVPKAQRSLQVKACQPDSQVALQQKLESTILPTVDDAQVEVHYPLTPTMGVNEHLKTISGAALSSSPAGLNPQGGSPPSTGWIPQDLPPEKEPLDWNTRMKIAAGAAKGLEYLHDKANPPVIYRDFKSSNILLDEGYHPKLSDFGLAKLGPTGDKSHVSTRVMGTYGYCAPEYAMTGQLTVKSDVYSFGVVLLELITGRKAIDSTRAHGEQNLVSWARTMFNDRKRLPKLADPTLQGRYTMRGLYQALAVASMCINEEAAARPLIADVVTALTYLATHTYEPSAVPAPSSRTAGDQDERRGRYRQEDRDAKTLKKSEDGTGSGSKRELNGSERDDSPREVISILKKDFDRERAVAEAKMWGENWREKRRASTPGNFDSANG